MNQSELAQSIRKSIANAETEEALNMLSEHIADFDASMLSDITLLESRFKNAQSDFLIKGILPREDYDRMVAQINYAILEIIEKIEKSTYTTHGGAKDKSSGRILHNIPGVMPLSKETRCIVRIAYDDETLTRGFKQTADTVIESVRISEVMGVELVDFNETPAFQIRTITEEEQFLTSDDFTQWIFQVKPILEGTFPLTLKVTVIEKIDNKERKRDIVLEKEVYIINQPIATPAPAPVSPAPQAAAVVNYQMGFEETNVRLNYITTNDNAAATAAEPARKRISTSIVSAVATVIFALTGLLVYNNRTSSVDTKGGVVISDDSKSNPNKSSGESKQDTIQMHLQDIQQTNPEVYAVVPPPPPQIKELEITKDDDDAAMVPPKDTKPQAMPRTNKKPQSPLKKKKTETSDIVNALPNEPKNSNLPQAEKDPRNYPPNANAGQEADSIIRNAKTTDNNGNNTNKSNKTEETPVTKVYKLRIVMNDKMKKAQILVNGEPPLSIEKNAAGVPEFIQFKTNKPLQTFSFSIKGLTCTVNNVDVSSGSVTIESCNIEK